MLPSFLKQCVNSYVLRRSNNYFIFKRLRRDIALELAEYRLNPWNVTQRIRRMNKRLGRHIAKEVAEKRGLRWALTRWAYFNWGATKEEVGL